MTHRFVDKERDTRPALTPFADRWSLARLDPRKRRLRPIQRVRGGSRARGGIEEYLLGDSSGFIYVMLARVSC